MLLGSDAQFVGFPLPGIATSGFYSPQFFSVTNGNLPPAGNATVVYMQDDAWSGVSVDHLKHDQLTKGRCLLYAYMTQHRTILGPILSTRQPLI